MREPRPARFSKLKGHGVPSLQGARRGDVRAIAVVVTPEKLSEKEEELLREFAALRGDEINESRSLLGTNSVGTELRLRR